ncbi:DUF2993 domain-containing protein [Streptomyces anandii]|uniref:DUF2993 domain-containing protein n=1 Tax=Streptomyces anandii TaxID=285454 RepID=UPI0037B9186B
MRRPRLLVAVSAIAVVTASLAGADALVTHRAEQRISRAVACRLAPVGDVDAALDSPLAAVRLLNGGVGDVDVRAEHLERQGMSMSLRAHLRGVRTDGTTRGGDAAVTVPYDQLAGRLARADRTGATDWKLGGDGKGLTLTAAAGPLGLPVTVHAGVAIRSGSLVVTPTAATFLGRTVPVDALPAGAGDSAAAERLKPRSYPLSGLPAGVRATGAHAGDSGLTVRLALPSGSASGSVGGRQGAAGGCASV